MSITLESKQWLILLGVLSATQDNSGISDMLAEKIMDQIND